MDKIISLHPLIKAVYTDKPFHVRAEAEELRKSKSSIHLHSESIGLPRSTNFSISFFFLLRCSNFHNGNTELDFEVSHSLT